MSANIRFESQDYVYMSCYNSNGLLISSNYYNNDTINRGEAANLRVVDGCVIIGIVLEDTQYYQMTYMTVSDVTMLPPSGIIRLSPKKKVKSEPICFTLDLSDINIFYVESPSDVATTIKYDTLKNVSNLVTPATGNNTGCSVMGNMGTPLSAQSVGQYNDNENICVDSSYIDRILKRTEYIIQSDKVVSNPKNKSNSIVLIILVIIIFIIVCTIIIVAYSLFKLI